MKIGWQKEYLTNDSGKDVMVGGALCGLLFRDTFSCQGDKSSAGRGWGEEGLLWKWGGCQSSQRSWWVFILHFRILHFVFHMLHFVFCFISIHRPWWVLSSTLYFIFNGFELVDILSTADKLGQCINAGRWRMDRFFISQSFLDTILLISPLRFKETNH